MLQLIADVVCPVCWIVWSYGFIAARRRAAGQAKVVRAPGSVWGIVLQSAGYAFVFTLVRPAGFVKSDISLIASIGCGIIAVWLGRAATYRLGKQWRLEAALSADHDLVQTGPYRWVRHPIYASMFLLLLASGAAWAWWPMFLAGVAFFMIGTEIRVRMEERLLADRFGEHFSLYRAKVPAYIPLVR